MTLGKYLQVTEENRLLAARCQHRHFPAGYRMITYHGAHPTESLTLCLHEFRRFSLVERVNAPKTPIHHYSFAPLQAAQLALARPTTAFIGGSCVIALGGLLLCHGDCTVRPGRSRSGGRAGSASGMGGMPRDSSSP